MNTPPPSVRVFVAGVSGSGKSTIAWRLYVSRFPRRLLLDQTGEWPPKVPVDAEVYSVAGLADALRRLAPRGKWTICLNMSPDRGELEEVVEYLIPSQDEDDPGGITRSPVYLCGGAVFLVDELDLIAPPATSRPAVRALFRRSRHAGLSVIGCTTGPENVSREASRQCTQVLCLHLFEPRALDYMERLMGRQLGGLEAWWHRNPHGGLWMDRTTGALKYLNEAGQLQAPATLPAVPAGPAGPAGERAGDRPPAGPAGEPGGPGQPGAPSPSASAALEQRGPGPEEDED